MNRITLIYLLLNACFLSFIPFQVAQPGLDGTTIEATIQNQYANFSTYEDSMVVTTSYDFREEPDFNTTTKYTFRTLFHRNEALRIEKEKMADSPEFLVLHKPGSLAQCYWTHGGEESHFKRTLLEVAISTGIGTTGTSIQEIPALLMPDWELSYASIFIQSNLERLEMDQFNGMECYKMTYRNARKKTQYILWVRADNYLIIRQKVYMDLRKTSITKEYLYYPRVNHSIDPGRFVFEVRE